MPIQLSRADRKILLVSVIFFIILIAIIIFFVPAKGNEQSTPSTYSSGSSGAKAAFLLLRETGYRTERWEQPFTDLKPGACRTLIIAEPAQIANNREREALHKFVREGNRLIAIGPVAAMMLPSSSAIPWMPEKELWQRYPALVPSAITRQAPEITMASNFSWASSASVSKLYGKNGKAVVVTYPYGKGSVTWWAAATPLTNAGITNPGNLDFFLACLGEKKKIQIYWDEYLHGYSRNRAIPFETRLSLYFLAQFAFLSAIVLLTFARRSGPVRPSAPESRLSPLEFVETLGGLYERAGASAIAVDICYKHFLYWLTKRLGLAPTASIEELEEGAADRWGFRDSKFTATLKECASARYRNIAEKRALQLIHDLHSLSMKLDLFTSMKEK
jgi:hypothetical protein